MVQMKWDFIAIGGGVQTVWCAFSGREIMVEVGFLLYSKALAAGVSTDSIAHRGVTRLMAEWPKLGSILDAKEKASYEEIVKRAKKDLKSKS